MNSPESLKSAVILSDSFPPLPLVNLSESVSAAGSLIRFTNAYGFLVIICFESDVPSAIIFVLLNGERKL